MIDGAVVDGSIVGRLVGCIVGVDVGTEDGRGEGCNVGLWDEGFVVGPTVGYGDFT